MGKKIVILNGSPRKRGNTAALVQSFTRGAEAAGNTVTTFFLDGMDIHGCKGCFGGHSGRECPCVQRDDMAEILPALIAADLVAFVSPIYYFGLSAQLKAAIDRFYAANAQLMGGKKAALLVTCADPVPETVAVARAHYDAICRYLGWQDAGVLEGLGLSTRADAEASTYPTQARALGASL